jgi:hypothetical protein
MSTSSTDQIKDSKEKLVESIEAIFGLLTLLDNYCKILLDKGKPDPSKGSIETAKEAIVEMAEMIKDVLEIEYPRINITNGKT